MLIGGQGMGRRQSDSRKPPHGGGIGGSSLLTFVTGLSFSQNGQVSFELAEYTGQVDGLGVLRLLDAIRSADLDHE